MHGILLSCTVFMENLDRNNLYKRFRKETYFSKQLSLHKGERERLIN